MSGGIGGGESGVPETLLDTKGQVHGFSTTNAAVDVGSDLEIVYADSAQAAGIGYGASARSTLASTGDILSCSAANVLSSISPATSGHVLTSNGATTLPSFQAVAGGGKLEKFGEYSEATEETSFTFTPSSAIDMSNYSAIVCYYSYGVAYSGVTAFNIGLTMDTVGTAYHSMGYTQDTTTLTGFQVIGGTAFTITDSNQNVNGSPKNYGTFTLTADDAGTYYNIWSISNGWNRDTRTLFGERVGTLGDITTIEFASDQTDGWFNSLFQFYGVAR